MANGRSIFLLVLTLSWAAGCAEHREKVTVSLHGDDLVKVEGSEVSLEDLSKREFDRPIIIRSFPDSSPILMHKVIDVLNAPGVEFEDGKFKGWRPDLRAKGASNKTLDRIPETTSGTDQR